MADFLPPGPLPPGKVPWDLIAPYLAAPRSPDVLLGPGHGEDAALIRAGGEIWAVASDPITFTTSGAGRLAVVVNANDVAVMGARPRFFLAVLLLAPGGGAAGEVERLMVEIRDACRELGVLLIGGHSEVTPGLGRSLVVGTMLGPVTHRPLTTGGLRAGDRVGMTKWAGLEGTAVLLADHRRRLAPLLGPEALGELEKLLAGDWLSVVPEAEIAAAQPATSALHDVTEGGVGEALYELSQASGLAIEARREAVPVRSETRLFCRELGLDPLGLLGSGALLVGCGEEGAEALAAAYAQADIPFTWIGRARQPAPDADVPTLPRFPRDELLKVEGGADGEGAPP